MLVLHSYHPGYHWTDNIQAGIAAEFASKAPGTHLFVEYMDTQRFPREQAFPRLYADYAAKYAGSPPGHPRQRRATPSTFCCAMARRSSFYHRRFNQRRTRNLRRKRNSVKHHSNFNQRLSSVQGFPALIFFKIFHFVQYKKFRKIKKF